jgi:FkbM family methyltransferase
MVLKAAQKVASKFGYQLSKVTDVNQETELVDFPCINLLDLVIQQYVQDKPDFFFIQIGAHDGSSADPAAELIRRYHWRGILVEPQLSSFKTLIQNYKSEPQLIFEQVVIAPEDGTAMFYQVREDIPGLPFWLPQSSGLNRDHVLGALHYWKHFKKLEGLPDDLESLILEVPIPALTMHSLLEKHNVEKLDFLMMATPGFDLEILKMFPFDRVKPPIISFEFLSLPDQKACLTFLSDLGYSVGRFAARGVATLNAPSIPWTIYQRHQY